MKLILNILVLIFVSGCHTLHSESESKTVEIPVEVSEERILFGPKEAPITIIKYADYQCPACAMDYASLEKVKQTYGDQVRFIHKQVPLEQIHPLARLAAQIQEALLILDVKKAQAFYEQAYKNQDSLRQEKDLWKLVKKIKASKAQVEAEIQKGEVDQRIARDLQEHQAQGFRGTPAYRINDQSLYGAQSFETFQVLIEALKRSR